MWGAGGVVAGGAAGLAENSDLWLAAVVPVGHNSLHTTHILPIVSPVLDLLRYLPRNRGEKTRPWSRRKFGQQLP